MKSIKKQIYFFILMISTLITSGAVQAQKAEYVLGTGDIVRISVFQNPDLAIETRVSESGAITFPLLGSVPVGGLSISAAEQKISEDLREGGFVLQAQVNILVMQVRGSQVSVLGQVNRPGRYPLEVANIKISEALALAGGITAGGSDVVVLSGVREGKSFRKEVDLPVLFQNSDTQDDISVMGGDLLYVHRAPVFYIYGEVQRPGSYRAERGMTIRQALAQGGSITARGTEWGIRVHRRDKSGEIQVLKPEMNDKLLEDDVIQIRESWF